MNEAKILLPPLFRVVNCFLCRHNLHKAAAETQNLQAIDPEEISSA